MSHLSTTDHVLGLVYTYPGRSVAELRKKCVLEAGEIETALRELASESLVMGRPGGRWIASEAGQDRAIEVMR